MGGNDTLKGFDADDRLSGGDGTDTIHAGAGDDNVDAGAGNDQIVGGDGAGDDRYYGGSGADTVRYSSATQTITVNLTTSSATGAQIGQDTLISIENVIGGAGNDKITGNVTANMLCGGGGKDALDGAAGVDTADYSEKAGAVTVTLAGSSAVIVRIAGQAEDTLRNIENTIGGKANDMLTGDALANALSGNGGSDRLNGGASNDVLNGGLGNDVLIGGLGNDFFLFNTVPNASSNRDSIADFNVAADTIGLENSIFTALGTTVGTLSASKFFKGAAAHDADDRIVYNSATGALIYDANGIAAGGAVQFAAVAKNLLLTNADFQII